MPTLSDNMRGAFLMAASMTAYTVNDAFLKLLGDTLPMFQVLFLRGVATVICLICLAWAMGQLRFDLGPAGWRLTLWRAATETAAAYFFIAALLNMDLANVSAILQALPLTVSLAGAIFLGEAIGWRRLSAILIGLAGVMLIVQPGSDGFTLYSLYALAAVACVTARDLIARRMHRSVPTLMVSIVSALGVMILGGLGLATTEWVPVDARNWALVAGATIFITGGYVFSVMAMRVGEIGFVSPFRYTSLLVALILGAAIFGTFPDRLTLLGAAIVVATGLFTIWREVRAGR